jgi:hypothetical protein
MCRGERQPDQQRKRQADITGGEVRISERGKDKVSNLRRVGSPLNWIQPVCLQKGVEHDQRVSGDECQN